MPDLTPELLTRLQEHKLPGLDIADEFIHPKYDDQSILNIPASICDWMGAPRISGGLLAPKIRNPLGAKFRKVILILMDALDLHRFQNWAESIPVWKNLIEDGILAPLTSVSPSTTSTALTSFWTGASPATHGILGYEMWTKEYSMVSNMIQHAPMAFPGQVGSLEQAGFKPETFLSQPTMGSHLWNHGVKTYAFQHYGITKSGLSEMFMRDVDIIPFQTPAAKWVAIRQLLEEKRAERMYIWTYWGAVDGLSHYNGPEDERTYAEFHNYSQAFERFFLAELSHEVREDTLLLLTADHGQTPTPLNKNYVLKNHPDLTRHLLINPTCENRFAFLYLHAGREAAVRDYFEQTWPDQFELITGQEALEAGLFGPGPYHPALDDRIGDLIAIARGDSYLWWSGQNDFLLGRHGGLNDQDMIVPFLATKL